MKPLIKVSIPPDWTGAQANAVLEILDEISTAVWDVHEEEILNDLHRRESMLESAAKGDEIDPQAFDNLPF